MSRLRSPVGANGRHRTKHREQRKQTNRALQQTATHFAVQHFQMTQKKEEEEEKGRKKKVEKRSLEVKVKVEVEVKPHLESERGMAKEPFQLKNTRGEVQVQQQHYTVISPRRSRRIRH